MVSLDSEDEKDDNVTELMAARSKFTNKRIYWQDICKLETLDDDELEGSAGEPPKVPLCRRGTNLLDMIYEENSGEYNMTRYKTNGKLLAKIQTGKGDPDVYGLQAYFKLDRILGGTKPENVRVDRSGSNDIERAMATRFAFSYDRERYRGLSRRVYYEFERRFNIKVKKFTAESKFINLYSFTRQAFRESFRKNIGDDLILIAASIVLVSFYSIIVLGGCSPVHMRSLVAGFGLLTILLSYTSC